ncbi:MAG TPA: hypothetical protein ENJ32_02400 [Crenotrichaceae bacterium]|nr:hypothetical protein [Crenotrichaceae bacterium]
MSSITILLNRKSALSRLFHLVTLLFMLSGFSTVQSAITDADLEVLQNTLSENQQKWEQLSINDYSITVQKSCFCLNTDTFPIQFTVENNLVTQSRYDCSNLRFFREEPLCEATPESRLNQTVGSLFKIVDDAIKQKADKITVEYDQTYGFPTSIAIDFIELAVDDEVNYQITNYKPANSGVFKITSSEAIINHRWKAVSVGPDSTSVMFYSAPSSVGGQGGVVRMRGGSANPEFKFQEWSNLDGQHVNEQIHFVTLSTGRWQFGESELEVGTTELSGTERWITVNFSKPFTTPPQVILALQTANGGDAVSARVRNITASSMQIQLVEEDSKKFSGHVTEVVGYLLIESPANNFDVGSGFNVKLLSKENPFNINHNWTTVAPGYQLRLEEDQTTDNEKFHIPELVHAVKIGSTYLSQMVSDNGADNAVLRSSSEFFEDLARKQLTIDRLTTNKSCDSNQQCKEIAFGSKPCGGPWSFLVYSTLQTNETTLNSAVADYNELQRLQNEKEGAVSDCSVALPTFPVCSDNVCVPGDQPPPVSSTASQLTRFTSDQELESFIKQGLQELPGNNFSFRLEDSPLPSFSPAPATQADRFSTTNIQETGVDEADFLKTDGRYMYVGDPNKRQIRILEMHSQPFRVTEQSTIDLDSENNNLRGLYLLSQRTSQQPDVLTTVQSGFDQTGPVNIGFAPPDIWYYPWYWMDQITQINVYNVSNPAQPQQLKTITIDGSLLASRLIGESLYVVTRYVPNIQPLPLKGQPEPVPEPQTPDRNTLIQQASLSELLPSVSISKGPARVNKVPLVSAQQTFLPPIPDDYKSTDLLTVSRFDLENLDAAPQTTTIVGNSDTIYVSKDALYLATSFYGYEQAVSVLNAVQNDSTPVFVDENVFIPNHTTQIHKIRLTTTQPEYTGSATIEGLISGNDDLRRFRFSEFNDILRVVTTGQWGKMGEHRVTLLQENQTGNLDEISHLPNNQRPQPLGKPNEQLHAARFVDNRLFLVTFLKTDPLIAIDLSNTTDPKIEGQLEIPGYSDYLHPINDNLLLGIGKHAVPAEGPGDGRFAWFQGIRVGLFDIADVNGPKELDTIVIGERSSQSEILYDIHAFSFLPADTQSQQPFKFTLPISVFGDTFPGLTPVNPTAFTQWSHTGLYLFEVDTTAEKPALKNNGVIKVAERSDVPEFNQDSSIGTNRTVLLNEGVFYSHNQQIWSSNWLTPEQAIGPQ